MYLWTRTYVRVLFWRSMIERRLGVHVRVSSIPALLEYREEVFDEGRDAQRSECRQHGAVPLRALRVRRCPVPRWREEDVIAQAPRDSGSGVYLANRVASVAVYVDYDEVFLIIIVRAEHAGRVRAGARRCLRRQSGGNSGNRRTNYLCDDGGRRECRFGWQVHRGLQLLQHGFGDGARRRHVNERCHVNL